MPTRSANLAGMTGVLYLLLALGCWTIWVVLSAWLCGRFSPLNNVLWTGFVSAAITLGGFIVHHRQLRIPSGGEWWLLAIFCIANILASIGYYGAMQYLPGSLVLPLSHLYLVIGPVLLGLMEKRALTWMQYAALLVIIAGMVLFLAASPGQETETRNSKPETVKSQPAEVSRARPAAPGATAAISGCRLASR